MGQNLLRPRVQSGPPRYCRREAPRDRKPSSSGQGLSGSVSTPSLASAGRAVLGSGGDGWKHPMDDRARVLASARLLPKERYGRQLTTAHEVGWGRSLERFGVSHHGVKRDPGLWPEA